ncbi:hypothetical protein HWQ46_00330 [Shewanella sp. D64]|uniref:hypothetical protein n=1 Tax=unclassified Shewanella TaxID=196818 RepID=UPI0022BA52A2|nr:MULTISPECIES: hypothetical protein [unclassified Shewanella]MEC4723998.1 hypothetical protein [Shewanella sp. D64]MEC4736018.1 hypothetical protein [Shewanella sp. E94]WBJ98047.1 hypothetical protein HWQ47_13580 [Shewanella sp. MTB7]
MRATGINSSMFGADNTVSIRTFCTENLPGILQLIHFYSSKVRADSAAKNSVVKDQFDHGFVYLNSAHKAAVKWRNKAGKIQFCGSGAYALAWYMLKGETDSQIELNTGYRTLTAEWLAGSVDFSANSTAKMFSAPDGKHCYLSIPCFQPVEVEELEGAGRLFVDSASGIYLLQLDCINTLENTTLLASLVEQLSSFDIHGFCAFYWNGHNNIGKLRYFVPWHGRDEDYVTGSIHQYLTPLVHDLYGSKKQCWQQISSSSGCLISEDYYDHVRISGQCQQL